MRVLSLLFLFLAARLLVALCSLLLSARFLGRRRVFLVDRVWGWREQLAAVGRSLR